MRKFIAGIAIIGAALAGSTAVANATPAQDAQFFALLESEGLTYVSADVAIAQARAMCADMDYSGLNAGEIVQAAMQLWDMDYETAVSLTAISIVVYCPWNDPRTTQA
ncbi:hypothetical protein HWB99_gp058 [Mycobacterium phage DrLupo]|uniref:DUF732 domain-containing protein n=1 Tax=Mycobacterium phage DrLupo TaxID=2499037 RepID=A0A3S9UQN8_9CAUD|nr:hypothetical protein HWB99_gp058 [Mycobacterium phage DrLupo]AZS12594.1 hypothetical protein SEA_DRLUPO_58 [Mycobacterium phage DrLupo]